jgi:hypothetical protein
MIGHARTGNLAYKPARQFPAMRCNAGIFCAAGGWPGCTGLDQNTDAYTQLSVNDEFKRQITGTGI